VNRPPLAHALTSPHRPRSVRSYLESELHLEKLAASLLWRGSLSTIDTDSEAFCRLRQSYYRRLERGQKSSDCSWTF
jgi:hypothetical protein